jgi:hypothetical protein
MAQTAVCNRHHSIDQQLCRWLLLSLDALDDNKLKMTQELIANMLGVRRPGVTEAARKLQDAGLISYSHGRIEVLDRPGLEDRVCECYAVVRREFDRLLPALGRSSEKASHPYYSSRIVTRRCITTGGFLVTRCRVPINFTNPRVCAFRICHWWFWVDGRRRASSCTDTIDVARCGHEWPFDTVSLIGDNLDKLS